MLMTLLSLGTTGTGVFAAPIPSPQQSPSSRFAVWIQGDKLTVDVLEAPLARVLEAIGELAGVEVSLHGDLGAPVTEFFAGVPLEEGIRRLTRGYSLAVTYAASAGEPSSRVLARIWVMSDTSPREPARSSPRAPIDVPPGPSLGEIPTLIAEADRDGEAVLRQLTELSASGGDPLVREQALAALERLGGAASEPALTAALADADPSVRVRAVRGLRGIGTDTALQSLTGALDGDADPRVRLTALRALTSFPSRTTLDGLARAAADPDDQVREAAARGLSWWTTRIGDRR